MAKVILNEAAFRRTVKKINEAHDYWREAEDNYLMREKLPKGWTKAPQEDPDAAPIYYDEEGRAYEKDEYGKFVCLDTDDSMEGDIEESGNMPENIQSDFASWAMNEADKQRGLGGPVDAIGLMFEYCSEDNDGALYDLVEAYKEARGIQTEPDSQEDIWISEEVRRAVNAWWYYNKDSLYDNQQELEGDVDEVADNRDNPIEIEPEKYYIVGSGSSFPIDLKLKGEYINMCYHPGECSNEVMQVMNIPEVKEQLDAISDDELDQWWSEFWLDEPEEVHNAAPREKRLMWLVFDACSSAIDGYCEEAQEGDVSECGTQPLFESYGIGYQGRFLKLGGWGPTFTSFPEDAATFTSPEEANRYIEEYLPNFGASVVSIPSSEDVDEEQMCMLKEAIKGMIRESINNMGGFQQFYRPMPQQGDMMEKGHEEHHEFKPAKHGKNGKTTKRAIVIKWLKDPNNAVNGAEIMRQLWNPSPEEEDTKRDEFYKKRDGAINKDSGARYSFSDEEINTLYRIKSNRS